MKKIMLLSIVFFTFFIVSCASSQHISDGRIQQSDSTNTFDQSFEAPCQVYDDDEFFAATGIYKGKASQKGEVQKFAHVNAQDICRMKVKHTYKGMVSDFSKSSGNNRGNNIETKISQAGEQIIDTVINDTKATCVKYSTVDAGGMIEAYVAIKIPKIDLAQKLAYEVTNLLTDEEKTRINFHENEYIKKTIERFEENDLQACKHARQEGQKWAWEIYLKKFPSGRCAAEAQFAVGKSENKKIRQEEEAYLECAENSTKECWNRYLKKFPNENPEHIDSAKQALRSEEVKPAAGKAQMQARDIRNSGISLMVIGTAVAAGGLAGFLIESDREHDKYKRMSTSTAIENAINNGEDKASYINRAYKHRDKSNLYKNLAITSGVVGGAIAITGVTLTIVGIKKRNHLMNKKIKSVSFVPVEKGFFTSLSFDF